MSLKYCVWACFLLLLASCNKDEEIWRDVSQRPVIEFQNTDGFYTVKIGEPLLIEPVYKNVTGARYSWMIDGRVVADTPGFNYTWSESGEYYVRILVETDTGHAEEEVRVDVTDLCKPIIGLYLPPKGLRVLKGDSYNLSPDYKYSNLPDFKVEWKLNGRYVADTPDYTFCEQQPGTYRVSVSASNSDGSSEREFEIEVVETLPYSVAFPSPSHIYSSTERYTFAGRPVYLRPQLEYFRNPEFRWKVNGDDIAGASDRTFVFTPSAPGNYDVTVAVTEPSDGVTVESTVKVVCVSGSEQSRYRAAGSGASVLCNRVFEYTAAPGQFVNDTSTAGFLGNETSSEAAAQYAFNRLQNNRFVSLGAFGGYLIAGFDHSILSGADYDFAIQGNAYDSSNEPGIVWVMQDVNGNGLPDDEWYELKGCEYDTGSALSFYEVTYFRPLAPRMDVYWSDNLGNTGAVTVNSSHKQDFYYPLWISADSYTLSGTCLKSRNSQDPVTGFWSNKPFGWGYADNCGSDMLGGNALDGAGQTVGFRISNAVFPDGTPVKLQYIDFIKVQSGIQAMSAILGEVSTEVLSLRDLH